MTPLTNSGLAAMIDHTLLKPQTTQDELAKACDEARHWHFASVCVTKENVAFVAQKLAGSKVLPIAVVDFPKGDGSPLVKAEEARAAVRLGAQEIDMVIDVKALKSGNYRLAFEGIQAVVNASAPFPVKVILETAALDDEQKIIGCALAKAAGAAFVKTSTGFGPGGATVQDVALMRRIVGPDMGVKASGGIRTRQDAEAMIEAGANRVGASASVAILTGTSSTSHY